MKILFYAKSVKGEMVKGAYIPAEYSHTGKHFIVDINKEYHEIVPESLVLKLPHRFIVDNRICSNANVIMALPNNNFNRITESPESLAFWLGEHADFCDEISCCECPYEYCDFETNSELWLAWLKQRCK